MSAARVHRSLQATHAPMETASLDRSQFEGLCRYRVASLEPSSIDLLDDLIQIHAAPLTVSADWKVLLQILDVVDFIVLDHGPLYLPIADVVADADDHSPTSLTIILMFSMIALSVCN